MNTKNKIRLLLLFLFATTVFHAQNRPVRDRIKTLKVAFITERLNLTSKEAQIFWPIYNEHEENLEAIRRKERVDIRGKLLDFDQLPDSRTDALLNDLMDLEKRKHQLNLDFLKEMSDVIGSKKTFMLIKAEEDFKKRLLKEMRDRRRNGG